MQSKRNAVSHRIGHGPHGRSQDFAQITKITQDLAWGTPRGTMPEMPRANDCQLLSGGISFAILLAAGAAVLSAVLQGMALDSVVRQVGAWGAAIIVSAVLHASWEMLAKARQPARLHIGADNAADTCGEIDGSDAAGAAATSSSVKFAVSNQRAGYPDLPSPNPVVACVVPSSKVRMRSGQRSAASL